MTARDWCRRRARIDFGRRARFHIPRAPRFRRRSRVNPSRPAPARIVSPKAPRVRRAASASTLIRTWILVALRAATEPVKEEAMQAIFVVGFFVVKKGKCAGMAPPHRATLVLSASKLRGRVGEGHSANRRAEKNRNRRIYWRPGFYVAGSRKVSPRLVWSVSHENRILGNPTRIAHQGRSLRRPILVGTQRESRYGRSLAGPDRFPGDATEGISTIEIESQSRAHPKSSFFVWQPVSEMPRFRVDNLAHEPPCSPHDRRRKNLFPAEKRRYSRDTSILQHTFFEHHTTNPKQKWPALPPPSPAPSRPSRRPRSRCASTLCHAFSGGPKRSSVNLPAHHPSSERFDRVAEARWRAVRAHRVRRSSRFNS